MKRSRTGAVERGAARAGVALLILSAAGAGATAQVPAVAGSRRSPGGTAGSFAYVALEREAAVAVPRGRPWRLASRLKRECW